ncbi:MAG: hypothetical protein [Caudoviricetes sp.]|nr:MAG: hypothetical protein [Caudoviricetes sp.]
MSHIKRMEVELDDLITKTASLSVFAVESNKIFSGLPIVEKDDIHLHMPSQCPCMPHASPQERPV